VVREAERRKKTPDFLENDSVGSRVRLHQTQNWHGLELFQGKKPLLCLEFNTFKKFNLPQTQIIVDTD